MKPPARNPIIKIRTTSHNTDFGKLFKLEKSSCEPRVVTAWLWTTDAICVFNEPEESKGPETFLGAPDEFKGPEVIRPVAGRTGIGPECCRVTPPDCGPDDFFRGSPCLDKGPEFVFFMETDPAEEAKDPDIRPVALGAPGPD